MLFRSNDILYRIRLNVVNSYGCSDEVNDTIRIWPNAKAKINPTNTTDCAPFILNNVNITSASYPIANNSITWTVKDSTGAIIYGPASSLIDTISTPNTYVWVVLKATSLHGCADDVDSLKFQTISNPDPAWTLASDQGCSPFPPTVATAANTNGNDTWKLFDAAGTLLSTVSNTAPLSLPYQPFGAVANPSTTTSTTFTIRHIVTAGSGCKDSLTLTFTVWPTPDADFSIPTSVCGLNSFAITNNSSAKIGRAHV